MTSLACSTFPLPVSFLPVVVVVPTDPTPQPEFELLFVVLELFAETPAPIFKSGVVTGVVVVAPLAEEALCTFSIVGGSGGGTGVAIGLFVLVIL